MRTIIRLLVISCLALTTASFAQTKDGRNRYKWKDAQGSLHIEDSIPPEAARLGYEVLNANGLVVRRVERARSNEEIAAAKAADDKAADDKRRAANQASRDTQMLAAYPTEDDLRHAQESQLTMLQQNIETAKVGIASQEKSLAELLAHAAEYERDGKPVPVGVQKQISQLRDGIAAQKVYSERRQTEQSEMRQRFADEVEHYRAVKARFDNERDNAKH